MQPPPKAGQSCLDYPIEHDPIYFCWHWQSALDRDGYGVLYKPKRMLAHRYVYENEVGPIPDGQVLDHWCRVRNCVNPNHLEPVSKTTNERRKVWRHRARMDVCCKRGHSKYEFGIRTRFGGIVCKVCE